MPAPAPPRKPHCGRGHDQAAHGGINSEGYSFCRACARATARRYQRRAKYTTRMLELLRAGVSLESNAAGKRWMATVNAFLVELDTDTAREPLRLRRVG